MARKIQGLDHVLRSAFPDEVVVHYDVVVKTRTGPDLAEINTYKISMPGSDPDLSVGTLLRAAGVLFPVTGQTQ